MKSNKRTNNIILWIVALGLLVSMVIAFTPGQLFGARTQENLANTPVLLVDDKPITELEVARARQQALYRSVTDGEVGDDLQTLMLDDLVNDHLLRREASAMRASSGEIREKVNEFRDSNGVAGTRNDAEYLNLLNRNGFTDASFRELMAEQVKEEKYRDSLTANVTISDEEVENFFETNRDRYRSEEEIIARQIIVDNRPLAEELRARALAGEDFAELAKANSLEGADNGGALGGDQPTAIKRLALPTTVASAAFSQVSGGITDVVEQGGRFYLVKVEQFVPSASQAFEEVETQVRENALEIKKNGVLETKLVELREKATLSIPEASVLPFDNPVVATVGETDITRAELARNLYLNPQVQNFLTPQNASFITQFFKPTVVNTLIDQELAFQGAKDLGVNLFGTKSSIAQSALSYVSKDAAVSDEDIQNYYNTNLATYTSSPSAVASRVNFATQADADAFRAGLLDSTISLDKLAENVGTGELQDLGTVEPGVLDEALNSVLFDFAEGSTAFSALSQGKAVSQVVPVITTVEVVAEEAAIEETAAEGALAAENTAEASEAPVAEDSSETISPDAAATTEGTAETPSETAVADGSTATQEASTPEATADEIASSEAVTEERTSYVVLIANRVPERVQTLDEVRAQVEQSVLSEKQTELRETWLDGLREKITTTNSFAETPETAPIPSAEDTFTTTPLENTGEVVSMEAPEVSSEGTEVLEDKVDFENTPATESEGSSPSQTTPEIPSDTPQTPTGETPTDETPSSNTVVSETTSEAPTTETPASPETMVEPTTSVVVSTEATNTTTSATTSNTVTISAPTVASDITISEPMPTEAVVATESASPTTTTVITDTATTTITTTTETVTEAVVQPISDAITTDITAPTASETATTMTNTTNTITITSEADVESRSRQLADLLRQQSEAGEDVTSTQTELRTLLGSLSTLRGSKGTYTVQEGDTLPNIAEANYGNPELSSQILEANGFLIDDAEKIFPGFELILPDLGINSSN